MTVEGDLINRCELFDEADLDAALARFDELSRPAPQLENAASRVTERFQAYFAARDWDAMAEILADDISDDDRRRVVNAGVRHGRDAEIANMRAVADLGATNITSDVIATRGERLALVSYPLSSRDQRPEAFHTEIARHRRDRRRRPDRGDRHVRPRRHRRRLRGTRRPVLAGEAAAHAHTWSVIAQAYAAFNRHELPATTPDWVNIDHRRGLRFAPGDMTAYIRATWDLAPDISIYIEAVHRLSDLGAVVTHVGERDLARGLRRRVADHRPPDGRRRPDQPLRALRRGRPRRRAREVRRTQPAGAALENAASQVYERFWTLLRGPRLGRDGRDAGRRHFHRRSSSGGERGRPTRSGCRDREHAGRRRRRGHEHDVDRHRDPRGAPRPQSCPLLGPRPAARGVPHRACSASSRSTPTTGSRRASCSTPTTSTPPSRNSTPDTSPAKRPPHAHTWSVITRAYAALNRRELPATTPDWVNIDHGRGATFEPGDLTAYHPCRAGTSRRTLSIYIEAVHRLSDLGAVVTHVAHGTSQEGFDAEWRMIDVSDGRRRPDQPLRALRRGGPRRRARAVRRAQSTSAAAGKRGKPSLRTLPAYFAARDWAAMAEMLADDITATIAVES